SAAVKMDSAKNGPLRHQTLSQRISAGRPPPTPPRLPGMSSSPGVSRRSSFSRTSVEKNKMTYGYRMRSIATSAIMTTIIFATLVEPAFAQAASIESILQNIVDLLTGNIFKLIATIAVILIAVAWMFGYMDLRRAGYWIIGI